MTSADASPAPTAFDHSGHPRWPLHPQPLPGETLMSTSTRTARRHVAPLGEQARYAGMPLVYRRPRHRRRHRGHDGSSVPDADQLHETPLPARILCCHTRPTGLLGQDTARLGRTRTTDTRTGSRRRNRQTHRRRVDVRVGRARRRPCSCSGVVQAAAHRRRRSVYTAGPHRMVGEATERDLEVHRPFSPAADIVGSVRATAV